MDLLSCLKEFAAWPAEIQSACVYQYQNRSACVMEKKNHTNKKNRNCQKWTDDERIELFAEFDRFGWDRDLAPSWARRFGRTITAIRGQFDHDYKDWKSGE